MKRERAIEISDALTEHGLTHTITVGVHDKFMPRERYSVAVTPLLAYWMARNALGGEEQE